MMCHCALHVCNWFLLGGGGKLVLFLDLRGQLVGVFVFEDIWQGPCQ